MVYSTGIGLWRPGLSIATLALSLLLIPVTKSDTAIALACNPQIFIAASLAGVMPPPGTYITSYKYFYSGDASGAAADSVALNQLGNITLEADVDVDAQLFAEIPLVLWVSPRKVLYGNLGLGGYVPIAWQDISVDVDALTTLTLPNGATFQRGARFGLGEESVEIGDPALMAMLGWHRGNWHRLTPKLVISLASYCPIGTLRRPVTFQ